jgi:F0F1-type ATP synthase delta subunit
VNRSASRREIVRLVTQRLIDEPQRQSETIRQLAAFIVVHKMVDDVNLIVNDIAHELFEQSGLLSVEVVSARQLTEDVRHSIKQLLRQHTGADQVVLHEMTDQSLLGGFVARTPDAEMDASVRTKLQRLAALA